MVYETLMEDEENQIRGYVHIVDCTGVNLPYMTLFTPKEAVRIIKNAEVTFNLFDIITKTKLIQSFKLIHRTHWQCDTRKFVPLKCMDRLNLLLILHLAWSPKNLGVESNFLHHLTQSKASINRYYH